MLAAQSPGPRQGTEWSEALRLTNSVLVQELRAFLCAEAPLGSSPEWMQLQPIQTSMLENVSRLPKQLLGEQQTLSGL